MNTSGQETGRNVNLPDEVFGIEPNDHVIYLAVKQYLANQRQGTHKAKERSEITGSTKKIKRQKGTGTARAGSIKSPIFRGGGRAFGPRPRDYSFKLNKKVKRLARRSVLAYKAQESNILVMEDFSMEAPKTKQYLSILKGLNVEGQKTLLVLGSHSDTIYRSARNLKKAKVVSADSLNTYDILHTDRLIFVEGAVEKLSQL